MGRGSGWIDIPLARDRSGVYDSDGIDGARQRLCGDTDNRNDHGDSQQPDGGRKREGPSCHGSSIRSGSRATLRAPGLLRGRYLLDPRTKLHAYGVGTAPHRSAPCHGVESDQLRSRIAPGHRVRTPIERTDPFHLQ